MFNKQVRKQEQMVLKILYKKFGKKNILYSQKTLMGIPVVWVKKNKMFDIIKYLRNGNKKYKIDMLYDLHCIDERLRNNRKNLPKADFTVVYHLLSIKDNKDLIIKVAVIEPNLVIPSIVKIWQNANWYEREVYDMFGIKFYGHPNLRRVLMPLNWKGYPLRKDYPSRATEFKVLKINRYKQYKEQNSLCLIPDEWGLSNKKNNMFLNFGPNHPSAHGAFRIIMQLCGEKIEKCMPDIGYHHRGAEKMGERQAWHSYLPYTDRIDYTGGVINNLPYILAIEKIAKIQVTERTKIIRVMMMEIFRINSHMLFLGTFLQDLGAMSTVFFTFTDRQKCYEIIESITGFRMHPAWFRIGGLAHDLPKGWYKLIKNFIKWINKRLKEYNKAMMNNYILRKRTKFIASYNTKEALEWGITGPNLRATGLNFDVRKNRPYSGYDKVEFDIPIGTNGDVFDRANIRIEEMYQSLRIIKQCINNIPEGSIKMEQHLVTPPNRNKMLKNIETLITHFLQMSWGTILEQNENFQMIEATKGLNSYYLISDGNATSYRTRIRTPSYPNLQHLSTIMQGAYIPDMIAHIASIDFVMADVDR
ncbi:NADH-quinone oxidoreductase subunit C/D [Candidatus Portiera aleyrodidarum]|uniref:Multifunctional fusion protein n=1 Tax=Candidatus Portiera aleyrodidarum MED (Bemisia tabaci) TaxID=1163752 RepID=A0AAU8RZ21_9GAMM|nr:NADH-quinone oxidoreductase subunit C/D [Candidatus Portiera aleyrodidarum]AFS18752.1 NADH-quinone oxidoreductase subunit C/D [Candidatus Portiera aleyrodidarum BT-QVLC]AJF23966.1 NADH:ubiquinone oxidoreductase [Candidatus Portiera aleyrodidarum MED (Bemisia tabaci)]